MVMRIKEGKSCILVFQAQSTRLGSVRLLQCNELREWPCPHADLHPSHIYTKYSSSFLMDLSFKCNQWTEANMPRYHRMCFFPSNPFWMNLKCAESVESQQQLVDDSWKWNERPLSMHRMIKTALLCYLIVSLNWGQTGSPSVAH